MLHGQLTHGPGEIERDMAFAGRRNVGKLLSEFVDRNSRAAACVTAHTHQEQLRGAAHIRKR